MSLSRALNKVIGTAERPAVDEWGIYDPDQAGLAAVLQRVEERRIIGPEPDARAMVRSMIRANDILKRAEPHE
jgi:hypothetical protein